ncbi:MAG TPA: MFS transporter [Noviherbaspirillum sp.]|jgi:MFS family permease|uniref:MFS transporter n=1 Tax=Noviherbaspirillum sp. TaxID=1926288 RepID=UPI002DDD0130|nr:MFS transporter [Noviherbaspirillum sp.]HEV2609325.1 MFS transporter [Noviherbaspirillum sp.]
MQFLSGALAVRVFLCFASAYFLSYAFRSINAVIAPALMDDVGLSAADLGLLSSAYFLTFAALQLPLGIWLDKYGPRRTETALLIFAAAGAALFAVSDSLSGLWLGRALIGIGVSACLMAPYKAYRQWFAPERQAQLASWMLVAGTSGALASTVPVNAALPSIGWRGVFWIMSGMILLCAAAIFFLLRKVEISYAIPQTPTASGAKAETPGYLQVFRHPYFRRVAVLGVINHGSFIALQTLWAGPWMNTVLGMDKDQTAQILFIFNFCLMLTYLCLAWWAPRKVSQDGSRGWPVIRAIIVGLIGTVLTQAAIVFITAPWAWMLWLPFAFFVTVTTLVQTSVSLSFPSALAGRANSAFNFLLFVGAFIMQWGVGLLIDLLQATGAAPADAMRGAFGICLLLQIATLIGFIANRSQPRQA